MQVLKFNDFLNEARINTTEFEYEKNLGGTTGAYLYVDKKTGKKYVVKFGVHQEHMYNEYTANNLYAKFGVKVPKAYIGVIEGKEALITEYLDDSIPLGEVKSLNKEHIDKLGKDFIFDVFTANWDVIGINYDMDNIRVKNGDVYRVDLGGALLYRAQGKPKGNDFSEEPSEQNTLRNRNINKDTAKIFSHITDENIRDSIRDVMKKYIVDGRINHFQFLRDLYSVVFDEDNGMNYSSKKELYNILSKRAINLYRLFNL